MARQQRPIAFADLIAVRRSRLAWLLGAGAAAIGCGVVFLAVMLSSGRELPAQYGAVATSDRPAASLIVRPATGKANNEIASLQPRAETVSLDALKSGAEFQELIESQASPLAVVAGPWPAVKMKHVIGATTTVLESQTELSFQARVDTGAHSCSMHVEKIVIAGAADEMDANVGKSVRFKVMNTEGQTDWIKSVIDRCINIKTSDSIERRYKVPLLLRWNGLAKSVLVTLNDRTEMKYPLLLGRNFLEADFVVDIELDGDL